MDQEDTHSLNWESLAQPSTWGCGQAVVCALIRRLPDSIGWGIYFHNHGWLLVGLYSSLMGLSLGLPCCMAAALRQGLSPRRARGACSRRGHSVLEVTSHHYCCTLLVREELVRPSHALGRWLTRHEFQMGSWRTFSGCLPGCVLFKRNKVLFEICSLIYVQIRR